MNVTYGDDRVPDDGQGRQYQGGSDQEDRGDE